MGQKDELTARSLKTLDIVRERPTAVADLANALGIPNGSASSALQRLKDKGLIDTLPEKQARINELGVRYYTVLYVMPHATQVKRSQATWFSPLFEVAA